MGALAVLTLVVAIWLFPYIWFMLVKEQIELSIQFEPKYVSVGETVTIRCLLKNKSWLPCPFVEISLQLPDGLSLSRTSEERNIRFGSHLSRREELELVLHCYALKRGLQRLQNYPAYVKINEGLGLRMLFLSKYQESHVTVMPSYSAAINKSLEFRHLIGRIERFHWLQRDESLLRGIRVYQPGDPFKYIAWQSSAAQGELMVKQFSASTEAVVCVLLNAQMFDNYWIGTRQKEFDLLCEMVATCVRELEERGFELKFATNAALQGNPRQSLFGEQRASSIRAILGELDVFPTQDFLSLWQDYIEISHPSETAIIFTSYEGASWQEFFSVDRNIGRNIEMIWGPNPSITDPVKQDQEAVRRTVI